MRKLATLAAVCAFLLASAGTLNGGQPLTLQVSPAMAPAPAFISVRAHIEANDDNRYLEVVAQSPDFYRSSRVSLDGGITTPTGVIRSTKCDDCNVDCGSLPSDLRSGVSTCCTTMFGGVTSFRRRGSV